MTGKKMHYVVLSTKFWNSVEECILASLPLLQVLRVVNGYESTILVELCMTMDFAKDKMKLGHENKQRLLSKVMRIIERH